MLDQIVLYALNLPISRLAYLTFPTNGRYGIRVLISSEQARPLSRSGIRSTGVLRRLLDAYIGCEHVRSQDSAALRACAEE